MSASLFVNLTSFQKTFLLSTFLTTFTGCGKTVNKTNTDPAAIFQSSTSEIKDWDLSKLLDDSTLMALKFKGQADYTVKSDPVLLQKYPALLPLVSDLPTTWNLATEIKTRVDAIKNLLDKKNSNGTAIFFERGELNNLMSTARQIEIYRVLFNIGQLLASEIAAVESRLDDKIAALNISYDSRLLELANNTASLSGRVTNLESLVAQNQNDVLILINQTNNNLVAELNKKLDKDNPEYLSALTQIAQNTQDLIELTQTVKSLREEMGQQYATVQEVMLLRGAILALERRSDISEEDIRGILQRLVAVETLSRETHDMSQANKDQIAALTTNFNTFREDTLIRLNLNSNQINQINNQLDVIRADMKTQYDELSNLSRELVANLGAEMQTEFAKINADILELNYKQQNTATYITQITQLVIGQNLNTQVNFPTKESVNALSDFVKAMNRLELEFVAALNPLGVGVDKSYDGVFRTDVMPVCGGNRLADFGNSEGMDSFQFLAQEYVRALIFTPSPDPVYATSAQQRAEIQAIFFNKPGVMPKNSLYNLLLAGATRMTIGSANQTCLETIQTWARRMIYGPSNTANNIRNALLQSPTFVTSVNDLYAKLNLLEPKVITLETFIADQITAVTGSAQALNIQLSADQGTLIVNIASSILDAVNNEFYLKDRQDMYDRIVNATKTLAREDTAMLARIGQIETQIAAINAKIATQDQRLGKLEGAMGQALSLIASMAARLGYNDLKLIAIAAGEDLDVDVNILPDYSPEIAEIQHFFKTDGDSADLCSPNHIGTNSGVKTYYQHGNWNACWINFRGNPATAAGTISNFRFRVFGKGNAFVVDLLNATQTANMLSTGKNVSQVCSAASGNTPTVTSTLRTTFNVNDANLVRIRGGSESAGVFDLLPTQAIKNALVAANGANSTWYGLMFKITPLKILAGVPVVTEAGNSKCYNVQLYSPLVLDFARQGRTRLIDASAGVKFDHDADGHSENTGWFNGEKSALLVFDDGKEKLNGANLFGQSTYISSLNRNAINGFEALAQYDANKDNRIDSNDPIFPKLKLWFDKNTNGIADKGEMVNLNTEVSSISLNFTDVSRSIGFDHGNMVAFKAAFESPKCGTNCKVYDVFFGTGSMSSLVSK